MPIASVLRMIYKLKSELSLRDLLKRRQHRTAKRCLVSNFFNPQPLNYLNLPLSPKSIIPQRNLQLTKRLFKLLIAR